MKRNCMTPGAKLALSCAMALALAACSDTSFNDPEAEFAMAGKPERLTNVDIAEPASDAGATAGNPIAVTIPQIAYVYDFGFRVAGAAIPDLQNQHIAMCERLGSQTCQVLEMRSSGGEGDYASGILRLAVASDRARDFGTQLATATESQGGKQISASIAGEDLSKQIVDTEARLRARSILRDRLMEILQKRQGSVAELVEAERGVAQVNEEIDQARSWLAEMRGRVSFSRLNVQYTSGAPAGGGFIDPIRAALGSIGTILGMVIAGIIMALTVAIPIGLLVWAALALRRYFRKMRAASAEGDAGEE